MEVKKAEVKKVAKNTALDESFTSVEVVDDPTFTEDSFMEKTEPLLESTGKPEVIKVEIFVIFIFVVVLVEL